MGGGNTIMDMVTKTGVDDIELQDIIAAELKLEDANIFYTSLNVPVGDLPSHWTPEKIWRRILSSRLLRPDHPHRLHQLVYYSVYARWDAPTRGPPSY